FGRGPAWAAGCRFVQVSAEATPTRDGVLTIVADPLAVTEQLTAKAGSASTTGWTDQGARIRATTPPEWADLRRGTPPPMPPLAVCAAVPPWLGRGATLGPDG